MYTISALMGRPGRRHTVRPRSPRAAGAPTRVVFRAGADDIFEFTAGVAGGIDCHGLHPATLLQIERCRFTKLA
jgi:hypothetical protein